MTEIIYKTSGTCLKTVLIAVVAQKEFCPIAFISMYDCDKNTIKYLFLYKYGV